MLFPKIQFPISDGWYLGDLGLYDKRFMYEPGLPVPLLAHDPGHHNTAAHLGVRTATHKLIHYWKTGAYELFDLTKDPTEQRNLRRSEADAKKPDVAAKFAELKAEIARLQKEFKDDGQYADPATWPKGSADGPFDAYQPTGTKTIAEAITATASK